MFTKEIETIVTTFFKETGLHNGEVIFSYDENSNTLWCALTTNDSRLLMGRDGETLMAINHLIRKIAEKELIQNKEALNKIANIIVDVNNHQKKRIENVRAIAHMMAERARYFKSNIETDPMPAFERRVIHEFLSDALDLKTESTGEGKDRRVVIKYIQ